MALLGSCPFHCLTQRVAVEVNHQVLYLLLHELKELCKFGLFSLLFVLGPLQGLPNVVLTVDIFVEVVLSQGVGLSVGVLKLAELRGEYFN